jgi:hypothetical protein
LHAEAEQVYADLMPLLDQLSEADFMDTQRFAATFFGNGAGNPAYATFLGYWYEHGLEHVAQYSSDRNDLPRASAIREQCAERILATDLPEWVKGWFLYNLATFFAQQNQLEDAATRIRAAVAYNPRLLGAAQRDPDLAALRDRLV